MNKENINRKETKKCQAQPYHLFTIFDEYFMFDTTGCRFYNIDELTFEFLNLNLKHTLLQSKKIIEQKYHNSQENIDMLVNEIKLLKNNGLFGVISNYINLKNAKMAIREYSLSNSIEDIQLIVTELCNLACKYCWCSLSRDVPNGEPMTTQLAKDIIDFLMRQNCKDASITFFGGEPLLNKPLIDFVMYYAPKQGKSHKKNIRYNITTNATLLDDKINNYIAKYNFGLMVSIDGPKIIHDKQCPTLQGKSSFDMAAPRIKELMKKRTVGVRATLTHPMIELKQILDFFIEFGFYTICICPATNRQEMPSENDFRTEDFEKLSMQIEKLLTWMLDYLNKGERPPYFPLESWFSIISQNQLNSHTFLFNCAAGYTKCAIDSKGTMHPCAKFVGMSKWNIGNLKNGLNIKKCKKMWFEYLKCIRLNCGKCWAYPICHGPCLWECAKQDGSFIFEDKMCNYVKRSIEMSAYLNFKVKKGENNE